MKNILKNKKIVIPGAAVSGALFIFICLLAFGRPVKNIIVVEDNSLIELLNSKSDSKEFKKLHCTFVLSEDSKNLNRKFLGKIPVTAAYIRCEKNLNFQEIQYLKNQLCFELNSKMYFPSIKSDFSLPKNKQISVTDPELSLSITTAENIPSKHRALSVEKKYAGQNDYALEEKNFAVITILNLKKQKALTEYLNLIFNSPELSVKDEKQRTIFTASAGDIMVARGVQEMLLDPNQGIESVFTDTLPVLQNNDITIGNLEGVVTDSWQNAIKTYTFKFKKAVLEPLKAAGFNYFMQTNNHCYDYGESGFKDTLAALKEYNCDSSGIGNNLDEAKKFFYKTINGQKFAIISMGAYPVEQSGFDGKKTASATKDRAGILWQNDEILADIKKESEAGNIVIVNVHGGEEYRFTPNKKQRDYYQKLIDNGASIVFGSHPHVLQPTEWYGNGLIVYSLGNFVFNGMEEMNGATDSEIVRVGFYGKKIAYVEQYPCQLNGKTVSRK